MEFAMVFIVCTVSQVLGYPTDLSSKTQEIISNEINDSERIEFKLPTAIRHNFEITVNGILNREHDTLTVLLPKQDGSVSCKIMHNFAKNKILVAPAPPDTVETQDYKIVTEYKETEFVLTLKARAVNDKQMVDVIYETIDNGAIEDLRCKVNFEDLSNIVFKEGVVKINSILFMF